MIHLTVTSWVFFLFVCHRFIYRISRFVAHFAMRNWFCHRVIESNGGDKRKRRRTQRVCKEHELNNVPLFVCVCVSATQSLWNVLNENAQKTATATAKHSINFSWLTNSKSRPASILFLIQISELLLFLRRMNCSCRQKDEKNILYESFGVIITN